MYCQAAKTVLRAAKGLPAVPPGPKRLSLPKCVPRDTPQQQEQCCHEALKIATSMLQQQDRLDTRLMALESLAQLTASTGECASSRKVAARAVLTREDIRDTLVDLIESCRLGSTSRSGDDVEEFHLCSMRRNALTVLANSFDALDGSGELRELLKTKSDSIVLALARHVSECGQRPHDACEAVRALSTLVKAKVADCKQVASYAAGSLAAASREGQCRHARLFEEARKLQMQL